MTNRNMVKPSLVEEAAASHHPAGEDPLLPEPNSSPGTPVPAPESDPLHVVTTVEPEDSPGAAQGPDEGLHRSGLRGRTD